MTGSLQEKRPYLFETCASEGFLTNPLKSGGAFGSVHNVEQESLLLLVLSVLACLWAQILARSTSLGRVQTPQRSLRTGPPPAVIAEHSRFQNPEQADKQSGRNAPSTTYSYSCQQRIQPNPPSNPAQASAPVTRFPYLGGVLNGIALLRYGDLFYVNHDRVWLQHINGTAVLF